MNPAAPNFGDFFNETHVHPLGAAMLIILGIATLLVSRRNAIAPMLILACFVAPAQRIAIVGIDFDFLRIITIFGWARVLLRREYAGFAFRPLDLWVALWGVTGIVLYTMLRGDLSGFIYKLGMAGESMAMYFLFRILIRDTADILNAARVFAWISLPVALCFIWEHFTGRNIFSVFGGVPVITEIRDGRLRCQGAFAHAILAGVFWATLVPIVALLYLQNQSSRRLLAITATFASLLIIVMCASSTPVFALMIGVAGIALYPLRRFARPIFFACLAAAVLLHLVMNKPIWHLLARVSAVKGSTGWHRFMLIDQAIARFNEWALFGTTGTAHWGYGLQDVTNQFIFEGINGGFLTLLFFTLMIAGAFLAVGRRIRVSHREPASSLLAWALGVSLAMHVASFIGVTYFGQIRMLWCLLLACIAGIDPLVQHARMRHAMRTRAARVRHPVPAHPAFRPAQQIRR